MMAPDQALQEHGGDRAACACDSQLERLVARSQIFGTTYAAPPFSCAAPHTPAQITPAFPNIRLQNIRHAVPPHGRLMQVIG